ncbi:GTP-binding protein [Acidobacterium sp. S8]|uniref:GTP-binding protein n=1 Tax=Acidobacterium sp. S8 TaxID=1641854 RepID=UPI00131B9FEA|nr:GTP-binding protein [Acidobacterium sp. S8]
MNQHASVSKPWIVVVGGFLGAGKTTLLLSAAQELEKRGLRSALILNDQGDALVDTELSALHGLNHGEVTGGCFCCRFSDLIHEIDALRQHSPDVIFAEPVGSCTDISATTLLPLREYTETYRLAPFTVLVDPARARELLREDGEANMKFLFHKQLQEADILCFTKSDLSQDYPEIPGRSVRQISAKTGQGVAAWLDEVLSGNLSAGSRVLDIDYEEYARAEAALAWLNLHVDIELTEAASPAVVLGPFLDRLDSDFTASGIIIVHLKAIIQSAAGFVKAAICANGEEPAVEGTLDASPSLKHNLLLNLRVLGKAELVQKIVERNLDSIDAHFSDLEISCFHPSPPKPERRVTDAPHALRVS